MLSRIVIRSEFASISIRTKGAQINYSPDRYQMKLDGNAGADINMDITSPTLDIDQTASFASAGLKTPFQQSADYTAASVQRGIDKIGQIAQDGLQFLRIERGGNPVAEQAAATGHKEVRVEAKMVTPPTITSQPGKVDITANTETLRTDWEYIEGESEYIPGEVIITLGVRPSIEITVEPGIELHFPVSMGMGINIDQAI